MKGRASREREQNGKRNLPGQTFAFAASARHPGGPTVARRAGSPTAAGPRAAPRSTASLMAGDPWRREEGKVPGGGRPRAGAAGPLRLRDWLVAQIESGRYAGLRWEDRGKTLFRIPWKHAAKQGYRAQQDAALFRAWAIYKGKHLEGTDKEDPSTWKTRLRCALNKSADFREVRERSQLDISNPYKVYQIVPDGVHGPVTGACASSEEGILQSPQEPPRGETGPVYRTDQAGSQLAPEDRDKEERPRLAQQGSLPPAALLPGPLADHRYQAQGPSHLWSPLPSEGFSNPGLLLWVAPEGVFAKRLCQGRVYWRGPLAPHRARPNKLERERTCQLLDTRRFLAELRAHLQDGHPEPEYQIRLCFGEEYPGPPDQPQERLIMAHVEPVFARELLRHLKQHNHSAPVAGSQSPHP
ncbi:PREDICTED: interferon regulatory factor 4-like [Miniopterus natalensis]|uniref:interferon regulatory factor 4-like n=1 Tax=Miniopterus natalensis TaxID=291302 RepID=UPI0007A6D0D4|nr:PREDICTED: interferon regulatory factor 4-like [Miniopterus natalensis]